MDLSGMLQAIGDPRVGEGLQLQIVESLKDKPLSEIGPMLTLLEKAGPVLVKAMSKAVAGLRRLPIDQLAALLHGKRAAKVSAAKPAAPAKKTPRKMKMTPARKAQLKVQGHYMGLLRGVKNAGARKAIKKIAAAKGMEAATKHILAYTKRGGK